MIWVIQMIEFTAICPNCKGEMAEDNKYCCLKCYEIDTVRRKENVNRPKQDNNRKK